MITRARRSRRLARPLVAARLPDGWLSDQRLVTGCCVPLRVFSRRLAPRPQRTASARPASALPFLRAFRDASSDCPSVPVWQQISWWWSVQAREPRCADPDRRPVSPADRADSPSDRETRRRIRRPVSRPNCRPAAVICQHRLFCCCVCWSTLSLPRYTSAPNGTGRRLGACLRKRNASGAPRAERSLTSRGSVGWNRVVSGSGDPARRRRG